MGKKREVRLKKYIKIKNVDLRDECFLAWLKYHYSTYFDRIYNKSLKRKVFVSWRCYIESILTHHHYNKRKQKKIRAIILKKSFNRIKVLYHFRRKNRKKVYKVLKSNLDMTKQRQINRDCIVLRKKDKYFRIWVYNAISKQNKEVLKKACDLSFKKTYFTLFRINFEYKRKEKVIRQEREYRLLYGYFNRLRSTYRLRIIRKEIVKERSLRLKQRCFKVIQTRFGQRAIQKKSMRLILRLCDKYNMFQYYRLLELNCQDQRAEDKRESIERLVKKKYINSILTMAKQTENKIRRLRLSLALGLLIKATQKSNSIETAFISYSVNKKKKSLFLHLREQTERQRKRKRTFLKLVCCLSERVLKRKSINKIENYILELNKLSISKGLLSIQKFTATKLRKDFGIIKAYHLFIERRQNKLSQFNENKYYQIYGFKRLTEFLTKDRFDDQIYMYYAAKLIKKSFFSLMLLVKRKRLNKLKITFIRKRTAFLCLQKRTQETRCLKDLFTFIEAKITHEKREQLCLTLMNLKKHMFILRKQERQKRRMLRHFLKVYIMSKVIEQLEFKILRKIYQNSFFKIQIYSYISPLRDKGN